jgi:4-carboxymuconolactone decarboxylase
LRSGATETEIKEVLLQMTVYGGYPKTLSAVTAAQQVFTEEVFKERNI